MMLSVFSDLPVFEEPYCDHGEGQQECVQQQGQAVQLVQLQLLFIIADISRHYAPHYLLIHCAIKVFSEIKMMSSLEFDYILYKTIIQGWYFSVELCG